MRLAIRHHAGHCRQPGFAIILFLLAACVPLVRAQYIGYVYPAGGQQGTTFTVTLGGQGLEGINSAMVSGVGVRARIVEYNKKMNPQEVQLLGEQLRELKDPAMHKPEESITNLIARIEKLTRENVIQPQSASIANLVTVEVTIDAGAMPGAREIRLATPRGISNPLVFMIGQLPELSAPPAPTSQLQILGKEEQSLRRKKRELSGQGAQEMMMATTMMMGGAGSQSELDKDEVTLNLPCVANGQISSGAIDRYRFAAKKGQRLVIKVQARELIPYMADAVPGWFQPVLLLCDAKGREVAYDDDYRFKPDPVVLFEIPEDGEYLMAVYDAIYRGREDFVYRVAIGELPLVTSLFPLGGRVNTPATVEVKGWNLAETRVAQETRALVPGIHPITVKGRNGIISSPAPFVLDQLPECLESETNDQVKTAQRVSLPVIVNGRIDAPGDRDMFMFEGKAGEEIVAEVSARRLDSPLDSALKLTDGGGKVIAYNDDREDAGSGLNTHHADSYIRAVLPASGNYYLQLSDAQHRGGEEYGYRLRLSAPQPDFALRVVPSSVAIRSNSTASLTVYAIRQDGFTNNIKLDLKDAPNGFEIKGGLLTGTQAMTKVTLKTSLVETKEPVNLVVEGSVTNAGQRLVREAIPAEDRMQAFLWRHLVPAKELKAFVYNPPPPPKAEQAKPAVSNAPTVDFPQGQMLHFNFDQWEPNNQVTDKTGRGHNGRSFGARWFQAGKQGGGFEFMATNSYIQVTNTPSLDMKRVSLATWFRTSGPNPAGRTMIDKQADHGYAFGIAGDSRGGGNQGKLCVDVDGHAGLSDGNVADGLWHHGAATYDGESLKLYVDGMLQQQVVPWHGDLPVNTNGIIIGVSRSSLQEKNQVFNGAMDEMMIFNHALSEAEVKVVIASTKPKFSKDQVARRLVEIKELLDRKLILQDFYDRRVKECEITQ